MTVIERLRGGLSSEWVILPGVLVLLLVAPFLFSDFFVSFVLTQTMWLGIAAASLIFLAAYGGMLSLAQTLLYGVAGFVIGNAVTTGGTKGLQLGWDPWIGVVLAIVVTTLLGFVLGLVASRSTGLYFLMITLTYGVIGFFLFGQVTTLSGFGGISGIRAPAFIGGAGQFPERLFYVSLAVSVLVYLGLRYVARTPFGLNLQGVRDAPVRMSSLGFNLALTRTLAFTLGAFVAALGGVLFVWWNRQIDPASIGLNSILTLLIVAIIGGVNRLEGAWVGAFLFVVIENYVRSVPFLHQFGITESRFNTLVGAIFLVIVLASPHGIVGLVTKFGGDFSRERGQTAQSLEATLSSE